MLLTIGQRAARFARQSYHLPCHVAAGSHLPGPHITRRRAILTTMARSLSESATKSTEASTEQTVTLPKQSRALIARLERRAGCTKPGRRSGHIPRPAVLLDGPTSMTQVRNAMGLGETGAKQVLYMIYYVVVRICAKQLLGSDVLRGNVDVTPKELQRVCEAARLLAKGLARYKNNWATEELLRQYLPRRSDVRSLTSIGRDEENREDNDKVDPPVPESTLIRSPNWLRKSSSDTRWLKIKHVLGLDGADRDGAKQALYDKYVAAVRMAANGAGFTYDTTFSRVQRSQLDFAVRIARAVQPGLAQYENNWLTVELLRAHYDHQRHFLRLAESVHAANPIPPRSPTTIPRPACPARGELSGSKLRAAMGLGDPDPDGSKRALYHNYMDTIRYSAGEAHYNFNMPVRMTPRALLGQIFEVARKIQPGLAQYEDDWASEAMLQHYVARKRARQRNSRLCRAGGTGDLDGSSLE